MEIRTWQDLADKISSMTDEQKKQPVQCVKPNGCDNDIQAAMLGIAIGTVDEFEFSAFRSIHNNKYCPNDVVLLLDGNPFAEDGARAYELESNGEMTPIYGPSGSTKREEQVSPKKYDGDEFIMTRHVVESVRRRIDDE